MTYPVRDGCAMKNSGIYEAYDKSRDQVRRISHLGRAGRQGSEPAHPPRRFFADRFQLGSAAITAWRRTYL